MKDSLLERIQCFRFIRDIPYRIALSLDEQDYCCATKTPMLQRLVAALELKSRRICCQFEWASFGLPFEILKKATAPDCFHEYLEVLVPEEDTWVIVDPTWDQKLAATGLPIAAWDGLHSTKLAITPVKTFLGDESAKMNGETERLPRAVMQKYYEDNKPFLSAINSWLEGYREPLERHA